MQPTKLVLNLIRKGKVAMGQASYRIITSFNAQFAELRNAGNVKMSSTE